MNRSTRTIDGLISRDVQPKRTIVSDIEKKPAKKIWVGDSAGDVKPRPEQKVEPKRRELGFSDEKKTAIDDFLEEVKDEDPTNLAKDTDAKKKRKKKKKKEKKKHVLRWVILSVVVIVVGLAVWKGAEIWGVLNGAIGNMTGGSVGAGDIIGADPTIPLKMDENGRTNILVFGTSGHDMDNPEHDGGQLADSIMVVSLDQEVGDIKTLSIPRDLHSKERCTSAGKMNETYWCEYKDHTLDARYSQVKDNPDELAKLRWEYETKAAEKFSRVIGDVTGLDIQYWVHLNWEALISVVDAIGGIDVTIQHQNTEYTGDLPVIWTTDSRGIQDRNWDWACKNQCWFVKYENGQDVHLDGVHAIALARARGEAQPAYGTNGNWSREKNQQAILEAIIMKVRQTNIVTNLDAALDVIRALGDNLRMSFDAEGIRRGIHLAGDIENLNMKSIDLSSLFRSGMVSVPGVNSYECGGVSPGCLSVVFPKAGTFVYDEISTYIAQQLRSNPLEEEGAVVDILNGTEQTGLAGKTKQKLEDDGYKVGVVGNASKTDYSETVIYVVNGENKPTTKAKLLEKFGLSEVKTEALPEGIESIADFVVILGEDAL